MTAKYIPTSVVGSFARPVELLEFLLLKTNGQTYDRERYATLCRNAVEDIVRQQAAAGIDIVSDGEQSKPIYADYVAERLSGFEGVSPFGGSFVSPSRRPDPFPGYTRTRLESEDLGITPSRPPQCVGPLAWRDRAYNSDIKNLLSAAKAAGAEAAFLPSPSPGVIAMRIPNSYYANDEEYLFALADVMRDEYKAIVNSGLLLQIDSPDAAMSWDRQDWDSLADFRKALAMRVESLNYALQEIPQEKVRFHACWGNQELPHTGDVPLAEIVDLLLKVDAGTYSVEAANPRHGHEWRVWEDVALPEDKKLMPGVIDTTTNFVEHPQLVADRIEQYARIVGPDRVIAGTDCGFSTRAGANPRVHPEIAIAKIRSLVEGARIAGSRLSSL